MSEQPAGPRRVCPRCKGSGRDPVYEFPKEGHLICFVNEPIPDTEPPCGFMEESCAAYRGCGGVGSLPVTLTPESAQQVARVVVAARLAETNGLMFGRFCGTIAEMHKRNAAVSEAVSALMSVLFPETTP